MSPNVFCRREQKYLITRKQKEQLVEWMKPWLSLDDYGRTSVRSLYYDTDSWLLIRRSTDGGVYREKLRLRSYRKISGKDQVFIELKKKFNSRVFKRRVSMPLDEALDWLNGERKPEVMSQIHREIDYVLNRYEHLHPVAFICCEREAYVDPFGKSDLRITFDEHIRVRNHDLSLSLDEGGEELLEKDQVLMEIKTDLAMPLWLVSFLDRHQIRKTRFSKYGSMYKKWIAPAQNWTALAMSEKTRQNRTDNRSMEEKNERQLYRQSA